MTLEFSGKIWYWRGPAPFYFVTVPDEESRELKDILTRVTYGWGMVPVNATLGRTRFYTALFHKDGNYVVPLKVAVRKSEGVDEGDRVHLSLEVIESMSR